MHLTLFQSALGITFLAVAHATAAIFYVRQSMRHDRTVIAWAASGAWQWEDMPHAPQPSRPETSRRQQRRADDYATARQQMLSALALLLVWLTFLPLSIYLLPITAGWLVVFKILTALAGLTVLLCGIRLLTAHLYATRR